MAEPDLGPPDSLLLAAVVLIEDRKRSAAGADIRGEGAISAVDETAVVARGLAPLIYGGLDLELENDELHRVIAASLGASLDMGLQATAAGHDLDSRGIAYGLWLDGLAIGVALERSRRGGAE